MALHIAILGWGSLLWDKVSSFDDQHDEWELNGPELKIEFSRISKTRAGALTLVIDPVNGAACRVAHTRSHRLTQEDAIYDLRSREGTTRANIGFYFSDGSAHQSRDQATLDAIRAWTLTNTVDVVVWTDLAPNFEKTCGCSYALPSAMEHLLALDSAALAGATEYLKLAPEFVVTPLRDAWNSRPIVTR